MSEDVRDATATESLETRTAALNRVLQSDRKVLFDYLYACLNVLDAKSNSLLQFNSIILVAFGTALHGAEPGPLIRWLSFAGISLTLVSSVLLLTVVLVRWLKEPEYANFESDFFRLRDQRTVRYKLAWSLALITLLIVALGVSRIFISCGGRIDNC
jgi:hypothetical protein